MVYQRKFKVKGQYIYYTLTRCKRDEHGNPRQEHIAYLGKNPLNEDELKHYKELERDLKPHEIKLTEIFHSIHKNKDGLIEYEIFVKKAKINGISKKYVDEYIELFTDSKTLIKIKTDKNIKTNIDEETIFQIRNVSKKRGFDTNTLEKVARLLIILEEISKDEQINSKLAFFGGTAINSIYNDYPRLSVDIDLQYIGSTKKETMLKDKTIINKKISEILREHQYKFEEKNNYALDQFHINYIMNTNHQEKIKIEVNYFDRVSILPLTTKNVKSPLNKNSFKILTLEKEELYAKKITALINRSATRDLYDVTQLEDYDFNILKKCLITNFLLREGNIDSLLSQKLKKPSQKEFKSNLKSVISKNDDANIEKLYGSSNLLLSKIVKNISKEEINFCENFNRNNPNFEKLFEKIKINPQLNESPLLKIISKKNN